jgi:transposase InsO family protein
MIHRHISRHHRNGGKSLFFGIKGYTPAMSKTFKSILAYSISDEARFRSEVINHFVKFGLDSTKQAFKVSRASIYRWKKQYQDSGSRWLSLVPQSRKPHRKRQMATDPKVLEFIKSMRQCHYRIGKDKIKPLLDQYCRALGIESLSISTIGKVITRNRFYYQPKTNRMYHNPGWKVAQRQVNYKTKVKRSPVIINSGYLEIDTIALWADRIKAYVYHAIDVQNRFAFAYTYPKLNSQNTVDFLDKLKAVYPIESGIKTIQSDNGLEFLGDFDQRLKKEKIEHLFIYPRCPKINGFIERANRSLREEFLNQNQELIIDDFGLFNQKLLDHLFWYNTTRPHQALKFLSPIDYLVKRYPESQMYVTSTRS